MEVKEEHVTNQDSQLNLEPITENDTWTVINSFFNERGLVS